MDLTDDVVFRCSNEVFSRALDGEAVLLDSATGKYLGLNEVGSRIWGLIEKGQTLGAIRATIVAEFEVDEARAAADLRALLTELETRGLVQRAP
jgi:hypothetical protein